MRFITFLLTLLLSSFVYSLPIRQRHISESALLLSDPFSAERIMSNSPEAVIVERAALARNHTPRVHRRELSFGESKKERELTNGDEMTKRKEKAKEEMEKRGHKTEVIAEKKDLVSNNPTDKRDESKQVEVEKKGDETQSHEVEKKDLPGNSEAEKRNEDPAPATKRMVNIPIQPNGPRRLEQEHGGAEENKSYGITRNVVLDERTLAKSVTKRSYLYHDVPD